jgi:hypothetical protein
MGDGLQSLPTYLPTCATEVAMHEYNGDIILHVPTRLG